MDIPFITKKKTLEESQQESDELDAEISVVQKRKILAKLKENGLSLASFGGSFKAALNWLLK